MPRDPSPLFACSWGDINLWAESIEWEAGETQVVHDLAAGDIHPVQHRGGRVRTSTLKLLFDDIAGVAETGNQAYRRFSASTKERRIFTHPMDGSYFARVGDLKATTDNSSVTTATCEFIPDGAVEPVSPSGAGTTGTTGESSVDAAADAMSESLASQGVGFQPDRVRRLDFSLPIELSISLAFTADVNVSASFSANVSASGSVAGSASGSASATATATASVQASATASVYAFASVYASALAVASATAAAEASGMASANAFAFAMASAALDADARASVSSWNEEDVPTRKVMIDTARLSDSIATMIEVGGYEHDLQLWPAFRSAIMLGEAIRSAAIAATSETPSVFVMRVQTATALLPLCAKIYGGELAQARARQVALLNDIRTRGWLDPGDYLMPARPTPGQSPLLDGEPQ